ncbi:multiple sugar transport system substrate-binding protein [Lentzea albidocapillata subsp. violacea]|uniref:Multiple sugar transport system substrate-binding protein n=1 Tax=Lentzea albidocapillata subsp. violacea TaxID=128104 RepID=A0A1G8PNX1_9PSEU|nr:extracellular solute-binding protein [Lentzea albidocapillata]SDI94082.1 multiple sugar transport system substrate-binding protein [Lentzea albidocapillata subsp. violacea]
MLRGLRRRTALTVLLSLTASLLAACGSGSEAGGELTAEPVTLRFTWWGADDRHKRTQQVIEMFQKKHPNITVKGEFKEWNGYWDSLATTMAANDAPDIMQMDEQYIASYAERGALLDLNEAKKHLDTADFDQKALATGAVDGKQYGLPVGLAMYSMVVNTDLLAKYGIPVPDDTKWTWDDVRSIGEQVSKAGGGQVFGVQSPGINDTAGLSIRARQQGKALFDAEGKVVLPPEIATKYWTYIQDLAKAGIAAPPSVTVEKASAGLNQSATATNTAAFGLWWNTQLTALTAASGAKLKLLRLPEESQAKSPGAYYKPSMFWSISSRSEHPAEAAAFVSFLANDEEAAKVLLTERGVPANVKIRAAIAGQLKETDKAAKEYLDTVPVSDPPRITPNGASTTDAILKRHTEDVLFGRTTPEAAAASFIKEVQSEVDAAK